MDRGGLEVERDVVLDLAPVERLAVGQRFGGERGARLRDIGVAHEHEQALVGGDHGLPHRLESLGPELGRFVGRDAGGHLLEGPVVHAVLGGLRLRVRADCGVAAFEHDLGQRDPALEAFLQQHHVLVEVRRDRIEALDVVAVVLGRRERMRARQEREVGVEARVRGHRHQVRLELDVADRTLDLVLEDGVVHALGRAHRGRVDRGQRLRDAAVVVETRGLRRLVHVAELGVEVVHADRGRELRRVREPVLPLALVQRLERGVGVGACGRGREREQEGQQERAHVVSSVQMGLVVQAPSTRRAMPSGFRSWSSGGRRASRTAS